MMCIETLYKLINLTLGLVTLGELREREAQHKLDQERAELDKNVKKKKKRKEISTLSFDMDGEGLTN